MRAGGGELPAIRSWQGMDAARALTIISYFPDVADAGSVRTGGRQGRGRSDMTGRGETGRGVTRRGRLPLRLVTVGWRTNSAQSL